MANDLTYNGIPRGVEVLVKKAAVDATFRERLLAERARAADAIGLSLTAAEAAMLDAVSAAQLDRIVAQTTVPPRYRAAFMGYAAAAMLAAGSGGCNNRSSETASAPPSETELNVKQPKQRKPRIRGIGHHIPSYTAKKQIRTLKRIKQTGI